MALPVLNWAGYAYKDWTLYCKKMSMLISGDASMQEMKRIVRLEPHEQLRQERQRRGWSRAYVAEQIGVADPKTLGRWERGSVFPSAYFLQKLCALFEMPAEELGLWQREAQAAEVPDDVLRKEHLQILPEALLLDPALPPVLAGGMVGRDSVFYQLRQRLCVPGTPVVAALSGLPGVGKTALALEVAHDSAIQRFFADGVLWVSLGPEPDVLGELRRWGQLLDIEACELQHQESVAEWARAIHARIGARRMLLIIDDAWNCQDALAFQNGGPNCAYVLTTRVPTVALYFANREACTITPLDEMESLELLARFLPEIGTYEQSALRDLARLADGLPLALQLMGQYLQMQTYSGQPRRWRVALESLQHAETRLQLTMPRALLERQMGESASASFSLLTVIEPSYRQLTLAARRALNALAKLAPSSGTFSEEAALATGNVSFEALDSLLDIGLLASTGQGYYTLHQTIIDFARFQGEVGALREAYVRSDRPLRRLRQVRESKAVRYKSTRPLDYPCARSVPEMIYSGEGETITFS
jgi:transcriptional regulator with XRE-family HTH domain